MEHHNTVHTNFSRMFRNGTRSADPKYGRERSSKVPSDLKRSGSPSAPTFLLSERFRYTRQTKEQATQTVDRICSSCICTTTEKMDVKDNYTTCGGDLDFTESITYEKTNIEKCNALFKNYLPLPFLIGSLCGLLLISFFVWVLTNNSSWAFLNRTPATSKHTGFRWLMKDISDSVLYIINFISSNLYNVISKLKHNLNKGENEGTWLISW